MLSCQLRCYTIALKIEKGHEFSGAVPVFTSAKNPVIGIYSFSVCVCLCVMTMQIELLWSKNDKRKKEKRSLVYSIVLGSTRGG